MRLSLILILFIGYGSVWHVVPEALFRSYYSKNSVPIPKGYDAVPENWTKLQREKGMRPNIYSALVNKSLEIPFKILNWCSENGVGLLPYDSIYFPESLRIIRRSPLLFFIISEMFRISIKGFRLPWLERARFLITGREMPIR